MDSCRSASCALLGKNLCTENVLYVGEKPDTALEELSFGRKSLDLKIHRYS